MVLAFRPGGKLADVAAGVDVFSSPGRGDGFAISIAFGKPLSFGLSVRRAPKTLVELSETGFVDEEKDKFQWHEARQPLCSGCVATLRVHEGWVSGTGTSCWRMLVCVGAWTDLVIVENPGMTGILVLLATGRPEFPQDFPETQAGQQEAATQAGRICLRNREKNLSP